MKLVLNSLLFASLCALSSWSVSSDTVIVTQTHDVSVMEGDSVNISCCCTVLERLNVSWLKNQTQIKTELIILTKPSQGSVRKETSICSTLTFTNIRKADSGRYICQVIAEIPVLTDGRGNGTVITVMNREKTGGFLLSMIIAVALVVSLLLITLVCYCTLRRKRAQAVRVIYEVPHTDSVEAETDKHSTSSSRGSSQWCQVPVYESFNYFQHGDPEK